MVKIKKLSEKGHEEIELNLEEARQLIETEGSKYLFIDTTRGTLVRLNEMDLTDDQILAMVPIIRGG